LSVEDFASSKTVIHVYPNPSHKDINIKLSDDIDLTKIKGIRIFSSKAQMMYSSKTYQKTIRVNNYSEGVYYIQIDFENNQITKKLIIK
jgi:tRNA G37 N-methylase Trm5